MTIVLCKNEFSKTLHCSHIDTLLNNKNPLNIVDAIDDLKSVGEFKLQQEQIIPSQYQHYDNCVQMVRAFIDNNDYVLDMTYDSGVSNGQLSIMNERQEIACSQYLLHLLNVETGFLNLIRPSDIKITTTINKSIFTENDLLPLMNKDIVQSDNTHQNTKLIPINYHAHGVLLKGRYCMCWGE